MTQLSARQNDAVIALCQNNEARSITVSIANEDAAAMLGYESAAVLNNLFIDAILPPRFYEMIQENVEFEDDSPDVDQVLERMREFAMLRADGSEIGCEIKITRLPPTDANHHFRLVVKNERALREEALLIRSVHDRLEGYAIIDEGTALPDAHSAKRCLDMVIPHVEKQELTACFVMIRLDRYEKSLALYGQEGVDTQLKHIIKALEQNLRDDDKCFAMGNGNLGVVLFNIPEESIRVVLNRLRWYVATHRIEFGGKEDFSVTISMNFKILDGEDNAHEIVNKCTELLANLGEEHRGKLGETAPIPSTEDA